MRRKVILLFAFSLIVSLVVVIGSLWQGVNAQEPEINDDDVEVVPDEGAPLAEEELPVDEAPIDEVPLDEDIPLDETAPPGAPTAEGEQQGGVSSFAPEVYVIQNRDTLWDVSSRFLGSPWQWPRLWAINSYITNPHLIYPGNELRFYPGSDVQAPKFEVASQDQAEAPAEFEEPAIEAEAPTSDDEGVVEEIEEVEETEVASDDSAGNEAGLALFNYGTILPEAPKAVGHISHSGEEKLLLSTGDKAYLKIRSDQQVAVGDRFFVYETVRKVRHPKGYFDVMGVHIRYKAILKVEELGKRVITARVTDCWATIERDEPLLAYTDPYRNIIPKPSNQLASGYIIEGETDQFIIGQKDLAYIDIGSKAGIEAGDELYVVRKGDGVLGQAKDLPDVAVGKMVVVDTQEMTSSVYVTSSTKTLGVGDRVTTKVGE